MKASTLIPLCLAPLALATCIKDNCARAVIGIHNGPSQASSASSACSSFLKQSAAPGSTQSVPSYASACTGAIQYSSACTCWGLAIAIVTTTSKSTTVTSATKTTSSSTKSTSSSSHSSTISPSKPSLTSSTISTLPKSSTVSSKNSSETLASSSKTSTSSSKSSTKTSSTFSSSSKAGSSTSKSSKPSTASSISTKSTSRTTGFSTSSTKSSSSATAQYSASSVIAYIPAIPTSYANCSLDPNNSTQALELIDANTGISFIAVNNIAVLALNTVTNLTEYYFAGTASGPSGVFDLVTGNGSFLALYEDGHMGFVIKSSNGQSYVPDNFGNTYVTSLWSVTCNGTVSLGIVGGSQYGLAIGADGVSLYAFPIGVTPSKRSLWTFIEFIIFIKNLLHVETDLGIDDPRCSDPSLVALDRYGTSPSYNGCGSGPFIFNAVPFVSCCNDHDICYDTCDETYLDCNSVFATCTYNLATSAYPGSDIGSQVQQLGYQRLASLFAWIVESEIGRVVFDIATSNRCDCCQPGQESCSNGCSDPLTDPNNCGACNNVCTTGICQNGVCSTDECNAAVCGDYISCNGNSDCQCYTTADGTGFCTGPQECAGLDGCSSNADCGSGSICAVGSCCEVNVCLPINCGNAAAAVLIALAGGTSGNATSASPAKHPF